MSKQPNRFILIDADHPMYASAVGRQETHYVEDGHDSPYYLSWCDHTKVQKDCERAYEEIADLYKASPILCLTDSGGNWRRDVDPSYKANHRGPKAPRPLSLAPMRTYFASLPNARMWPRLEADDVIGILATKPQGKKHIQMLIWSPDKDLLTIPGEHAQALTGTTKVVSKEEASRAHLMQTLTGDTADGYPGCPGVGKVTAERWLDKEGATWDAVVRLYEKNKLTEEDALKQARMARILHWNEFDYAHKRPIWWSPTNA